jgi:hypothetical protein
MIREVSMQGTWGSGLALAAGIALSCEPATRGTRQIDEPSNGASVNTGPVVAPDAFHDFTWRFTEGANASGYMANITGNARGAGLTVAYADSENDERAVSVIVSVTERFAPSEYGGDALALVRFRGQTIDAIRVAAEGAPTWEAFDAQMARRLVGALIRSPKVVALVERERSAEKVTLPPKGAIEAPESVDDPRPPRAVVEVRDLGAHTQQGTFTEHMAFDVPGTRWRCTTGSTFVLSPDKGNPDSIPFPERSYSVQCGTGDATAGISLMCPTSADNLRAVLRVRNAKFLAEVLVLVDRRGVSDERRFVTLRCEPP